MRTLILAGLLVAGFAAPAFASGDGPAVPQWNEIGAAIINMAIYIGALVYFGRKPVLAHFQSRRDALVSRMESAQTAEAAAQAALVEVESRLSAMESERASLVAEYRDLGQKEAAKMVADAKAQAEKIRKDGELQAEQIARSAEEALRVRLMERALEMAQSHVASQATMSAQAGWINGSIRQLQASGSTSAQA
jgi:F-type H+-transporting ATPase subunit b